MNNFATEFANEVRIVLETSQAAEKAKSLGLKYAGFGYWKDQSNKVVAKTVKGRLSMLSATKQASNTQANTPVKKNPKEILKAAVSQENVRLSIAYYSKQKFVDYQQLLIKEIKSSVMPYITKHVPDISSTHLTEIAVLWANAVKERKTPKGIYTQFVLDAIKWKIPPKVIEGAVRGIAHSLVPLQKSGKSKVSAAYASVPKIKQKPVPNTAKGMAALGVPYEVKYYNVELIKQSKEDCKSSKAYANFENRLKNELEYGAVQSQMGVFGKETLDHYCHKIVTALLAGKTPKGMFAMINKVFKSSDLRNLAKKVLYNVLKSPQYDSLPYTKTVTVLKSPGARGIKAQPLKKKVSKFKNNKRVLESDPALIDKVFFTCNELSSKPISEFLPFTEAAKIDPALQTRYSPDEVYGIFSDDYDISVYEQQLLDKSLEQVGTSYIEEKSDLDIQAENYGPHGSWFIDLPAETKDKFKFYIEEWQGGSQWMKWDKEERDEKVYPFLTDIISNKERPAVITTKTPLYRGICLPNSQIKSFLSKFTPGKTVVLPPSGFSDLARIAIGFSYFRDPESAGILIKLLPSDDNKIRALPLFDYGFFHEREYLRPGRAVVQVMSVQKLIHVVVRSELRAYLENYVITLKETDKTADILYTESVESSKPETPFELYGGGSMHSAERESKFRAFRDAARKIFTVLCRTTNTIEDRICQNLLVN